MTESNEFNELNELSKNIETLKEKGFNIHSLLKNRYDLTEDEQIALLRMTPKEKKQFFKLRKQK